MAHLKTDMAQKKILIPRMQTRIRICSLLLIMHAIGTFSHNLLKATASSTFHRRSGNPQQFLRQLINFQECRSNSSSPPPRVRVHSFSGSNQKCAFVTSIPNHQFYSQRTQKTAVRDRSSGRYRPSSSTSLSSSRKPGDFKDGQRVQVIFDGAQYEGVVKGKKGGWYSVEIPNQDGIDTSIVKRRGAQMSVVDKGDSQIIQEEIPTTLPLDGKVGQDLMDTIVNEEETMQDKVSTIPSGSIQMNLNAPTIADLDASLRSMENCQDIIKNKKQRLYLEQCKHFSSFEKWVTFTDLHCAPNTLRTCLNVLEVVHAQAKEQNAGVLFLGDFWHHRGTVRVDCLNAVLHALSDWEVPMIMIPGNHDQVSLGGLEHALTPLQNAYRVPTGESKDVPGILIFSHPTKFCNALFVPHIRDICTLQSILQSKTSAASSAVFVHADVTGAYMNDLITSTGGVAPAYFPPSIPIYSGHFHKPHIVEKPEAAPGVSIRYVGSPYETTLAEARQEKALLVLDASQGWQCVKEIPLAIGRRHWRAKNIQEFLELEAMNDHNMNDSIAGPLALVTAGDRVVVSVYQEELEVLRRESLERADCRGKSGLSLFDDKVKQLRAVGASVEIRESRTVPNLNHVIPASNSIDAQHDDLDWLLVEDMSPFTTWSNYLKNEVQREAMKNSTAEVLLKAGSSILEDLGLSGTSIEDNSRPNSFDATNLCLDTITVEGFGPFKDSTTYPLSGRGLVLLRGSNKDGGSDSNGSGKSTLAMASLWALTGSIDPRPAQDGKVSDVVHDNSKTAKVTVRGTINGDSFMVARSKSKSRGSLTFILDDKDLTKQSAKETQATIEEKLGAGPQVLSRTIFHGQYTMNGLLEATDAKLKEELSIIVPLNLWQQATAIARKDGRTLSKTISELDGMIAVRSRDYEAMERRCDDASKNVATKEKIIIEMEEEIKKRFEEKIDDNDEYICIENIQIEINRATEKIQALEDAINNNIVSLQTELNPLRILSDEKKSLLREEKSKLYAIQREIDRNEALIFSVRENINALQSKWGIGDPADIESANFTTPSTCPTCKQPVLNNESHHHFKTEIKADFTTAKSRTATLDKVINGYRKELSTRQNIVDDLDNDIQIISFQINENESTWEEKQAKLQLDLQKSRTHYSRMSKDLADAVERSEATNRLKRLKSNSVSELKVLKESLNNTIDARNIIIKDLENLMNSINNLESQREKARSDASIILSAAEHFGARGVQTFILQNTVQALQLAAQSYLDELSDGTLRLKLVLDTGDRILRTVSVLNSDGSWIPRPLSALSGGQWRRCSLALSLGFSDLVARRGRLRSSLLVLDEPLTHLDSAGRDNVGKLLRKIVQKQVVEQSGGHSRRIGGGLSVSTVLIILQDLVAEELSESFDCIDEVVKFEGESRVAVDEILYQ